MTLEAPLEKQFKLTSLFKDFMNAVLTAILIFLGILSFVLIYSLMLSDVDSKTYEYGMLRALGFKSEHLVGLLTLQSLSFSMPGLIVGLFTAMIFNVLLRMLIFISALNFSDYDLTAISIFLGFVMGIVIPLFANIYPIKSALGRNLRDSLDLNMRDTNTISVNVQRLEDIGVDVSQTLIAILLVALGIGTYYWIPLTILNLDFGQLFFLLNILLLIVIIGLALLCILFFRLGERLILWILLNTCFKKDRSIHSLILKSMKGHQQRNMKTSIMFSLAVSFSIFASSAFRSLGRMSMTQAASLVGADFLVQTGIGQGENI